MRGNQSPVSLAALATERRHRFLAEAHHAPPLALLAWGHGDERAWQRVSYGLSASARGLERSGWDRGAPGAGTSRGRGSARPERRSCDQEVPMDSAHVA